MQAKQTDVVINGCGIGGAVLAYMLGQKGLNVTVVEQADRERAVNGADLLKPSGIQVLRDLGLYDDILRAGGRVRDRLRVFHDKEHLCSVDYKHSSELGSFILIPCEWLRLMVLDKIETLPSVEVLFRTRITEVERDAAGKAVSVQLSDGRTLAPSVLVGADGMASYVRKLLGMTAERYTYPAPMYFTVLPLTPSVDECNRLYVDSSQGLAYFYPIGTTETRLVISFLRDEMQQLLDDDSGAALRARLRKFVSEESEDAIEQITDTKSFKGTPLGRLNLKTYYSNNIVMLGDAIHNIHPITGQGMNLAIEDAGELGNRLISVFSGEATLADALEAYQRCRHPVNESVVAYGHHLATSFHDKSAFGRNFDVALQTSSRDPKLIASRYSSELQRAGVQTSPMH